MSATPSDTVQKEPAGSKSPRHEDVLDTTCSSENVGAQAQVLAQDQAEGDEAQAQGGGRAEAQAEEVQAQAQAPAPSYTITTLLDQPPVPASIDTLAQPQDQQHPNTNSPTWPTANASGRLVFTGRNPDSLPWIAENVMDWLNSGEDSWQRRTLARYHQKGLASIQGKSRYQYEYNRAMSSAKNGKLSKAAQARCDRRASRTYTKFKARYARGKDSSGRWKYLSEGDQDNDDSSSDEDDDEEMGFEGDSDDGKDDGGADGGEDKGPGAGSSTAVAGQSAELIFL